MPANGRPCSSRAVFQSTPAITGGRCLAPSWLSVRPNAVSIHARHYWRAMLRPLVLCFAPGWFQSTPAITGGRCHLEAASGHADGLFQSTPAITGGRCPSYQGYLQGITWFQSTPAITGGRCLDVHGRLLQVAHVSIHARHYWRAMPGCNSRRIRQGPIVSIHARHYWRAMQPNGAQYPLAVWFQSTPAITGGRCLLASCGVAN